VLRRQIQNLPKLCFLFTDFFFRNLRSSISYYSSRTIDDLSRFVTQWFFTMKEPAIFPVSPPHSRLANERLSGFKRRAPFGHNCFYIFRMIMQVQPHPSKSVKGSRHIPASRGCRSRHHHSAKRCEQTPELYLPDSDISAHCCAAPPPPACARSDRARTATPSSRPPSNNAAPTRTGTRLPSLRKYSFSKGSQTPVRQALPTPARRHRAICRALSPSNSRHLTRDLRGRIPPCGERLRLPQ